MTPIELRKARYEMELTQPELAELLGYAPRREHISRMECGHDPITERMANAVNTHLKLYRLTRDKKSRKNKRNKGDK